MENAAPDLSKNLHLLIKFYRIIEKIKIMKIITWNIKFMLWLLSNIFTVEIYIYTLIISQEQNKTNYITFQTKNYLIYFFLTYFLFNIYKLKLKLIIIFLI